MWKARRVSIARLTVVSCTAAVVMALAAPAAAQNEDALKAFFEGRRVVTKIDMPGTSDGVDVNADANPAVDYSQYGNRLKSYGTALRAGDQAIVTLVKVKKDLIEFQLGGGGFGTFGDDTSTSVHIPSVDKSSREKELERRVRTRTTRAGGASFSPSSTSCAIGVSARTGGSRPSASGPKSSGAGGSPTSGCRADRASTSATRTSSLRASGRKK